MNICLTDHLWARVRGDLKIDNRIERELAELEERLKTEDISKAA